MGYLERTRSPQLRQPSQQRHHEFPKVKCALIETPVVLVSIKIAAVIVGIAAIKPIEPESMPKPFVAKMPTMEPTGQLMKSSAAEGAAAKTTAEGACVETASEAAAMESTATMATAPAPSQRFVVGHQDRSEEGAGDNHWKLVFISLPPLH
jgi:hypothetical protein